MQTEQDSAAVAGSLDELHVRGGERQRHWYRCERVFCADGAWYFHTREGVNVGPYVCQFDAELEAGLLTQKLKQSQKGEATAIIRDHMLDALGDSGALNTATFTDYLVESGGIEILQREAFRR